MSSSSDTGPVPGPPIEPVGTGKLVKNCRVCGVPFRTNTGRAATCPQHRVRRYARDLQTNVSSITAERMVTAEDALLRGYTPERVALLLGKEWGVDPKMVRRDYVDPVMKLWSATARADDRETRRDKLRARFEDAYRRAATRRSVRKRTQVIPDEKGQPKAVTVSEEVDAPDFKAMASFGKLLVEIDGLGTVNVNATHAHVISSAMAAVAARRLAISKQERVVEAKVLEAQTKHGDPLDAALGLKPGD